MTIYDLLDDDTRRKLNAKKPVVHRKLHKNNERLSRDEWHDIMGMNRGRYVEKNGKVKRQ